MPSRTGNWRAGRSSPGRGDWWVVRLPPNLPPGRPEDRSNLAAGRGGITGGEPGGGWRHLPSKLTRQACASCGLTPPAGLCAWINAETARELGPKGFSFPWQQALTSWVVGRTSMCISSKPAEASSAA